jgi:hypothetical protein
MTRTIARCPGTLFDLAAFGGSAPSHKPAAQDASKESAAQIAAAQAQQAMQTALDAECQTGHTVSQQMLSATTVSDFVRSVDVWTAELTAANSIPMTWVPVGGAQARGR